MPHFRGYINANAANVQDMDMDASGTLTYLLNHIFLPLRLPQSDDHDIEGDLAICDQILDHALAFQAFLSPSQSTAWNSIFKMMQTLRRLQSASVLDVEVLEFSMRDLIPGGVTIFARQNIVLMPIQLDVLVIPVRMQNACLIIRKIQGHVLFESFEVDPPNAEVMGTIGRLIRSFPGPAIKVPDASALDESFQHELASFLAQMDTDTLEESAPFTTKANSTVLEARDTADPHYITDLLTSILRGLTDSCPADIHRIEKHTRNDILWDKAYKPWRRSPLWLIIRVTIQTTLCRALGHSGTAEFKAFMIFFMASIALSHDCNALSSDVLHCMRAKLARRLRKLSTDLQGFVVDRASEAIKAINRLLETRWQELQHPQKRSLWEPERLSIEADTRLSLCNSRDHIRSRLSHAKVVTSLSSFAPAEFPRLVYTLEDPDCFTHATLSAAFAGDPIISLLDLELFVAELSVTSCLNRWVEAHLHDASACVTLSDCITLYAASSGKHYQGDPENESIRLLTILQMWVALDRLATAQHPLLLHYSPEIPEGLLEPLLFRDSLFIGRLRYVQTYLSTRRSRATKGSVFDEKVTKTSFAIRYFNSSVELQGLKGEIEDDAEATRKEKCKELRQKKSQYDSLIQRARSLSHVTSILKGKEGHWHWKCDKCRSEGQAKKLEIKVHEWPLPTNDLLAKAVVFELGCPLAFQTWRDTIYIMLHDFFRPSKVTTNKANPPVLLEKYSGLLPYIGSLSRVTFASSTKSFSQSHYASQKVSSATETSVCVNNGLNFALLDTKLKRWTANSFMDCGIEMLCTYTLPSDGPYRLLQGALQTTTNASNVAIAQQALASTQITLHEYMAFSTLRCGPMLQWLNLARELRAGVLSFSRLEVQMLVAQAVMQIGPLSSLGDPEWHVLLKCPRFGKAILAEIDSILTSIEGNWLQVVTLQTVLLLVTQLLNFAVDEHVVDSGCAILKRAREIAFAWVLVVSNLLAEVDSEESIRDFRRRLRDAAIACKATYDSSAAHLPRLLHSDSDVMKLIYCSIVVQDNTLPGNPLTGSHAFRARDTRLSHFLAPALWDIIQEKHKGLDDALTAIWSEYRPGSGWEQLPHPNDRWVTTSTPVMDSHARSTVHLNLLDGALLINGKPLKRLPSSIVTHPTFCRVLGSVCIPPICP